MTGTLPYTGHSLQYLTADLKTGLDNWRPLVEAVLASGQSCVSELMFWLKPMGFKFQSNRLTIPSSVYASTSLWTNIELFWLDWHWYYAGRKTPETDPNRAYNTVYLITSPAPDQSGLTTLISSYPLTNTFFTILDALYDRVYAALSANSAYLAAHIPEFSIYSILSGLIVLFGFFLMFSTADSPSWGYLKFYTPTSEVGTVGPYTISVNYCENGFIYGFAGNLPLKVNHQSVDADILIQNEVQKSLTARENISGAVPTELSADIALQGNVPTSLPASVCIIDMVQNSLRAHEYLGDVVKSELVADELLADTNLYSLYAYERLVKDSKHALEADICLFGKVLTPLAAYMLLLPDSASEVKVDLEKYHIQKFRIRARPISYKEYNSKTDKEVVP